MSEIYSFTCKEYDDCIKIVEKVEKILGKKLEQLVLDDWRRPIVDAVFLSISFYGVTPDRIRTLMEILIMLGYRDLANSIRKAVINDYEEKLNKLKTLLEQAQLILNELKAI